MTKHGALAVAVTLLLAGAATSAEPAGARRSLDRWIEQLGNKDGRGREEAVQAIAALGQAGRPAAPALAALLKGPDSWFVVQVARALLAIGAPQAEVATRELLLRRSKCIDNLVEGPYLEYSPGTVVRHLAVIVRKDRDVHARVVAAEVLGRLRTRTKPGGATLFRQAGPSADLVVPALIGALKDDSPRMRLAAASALVALDARQSRTVTATVVALIADGHAATDAAAQLLRHAESAAVPAFARLLDARDEKVRARASRALANLAPASLPALTKALREGPARSRLAAAQGLSGVYCDMAATVPALTAALADADKAVRCEVALTLARAAPKKARPALPVLVAALREGGPYEGPAASALARLGAEARPVVPELLRALKDERRQSRFQAAWALAAIEPSAAAPAVPALVEALGSKGEIDRRVAARAAEQIGPAARATVPALRAALTDRSLPLRLAAAKALVKIDRTEAKVAVPVLCAMVEAKRLRPGYLRAQALEALAGMGPDAAPAVGPLLVVLARDRDDPFWADVAGAVVRIAPARSAPAMKALRDALRSANGELADEALDVLERLGPLAREAVPELTELLRSRAAYFVQRAAQVLGKIGPDARAAVAPLRARRADKLPSVRKAAEEALRQIETAPAVAPAPADGAGPQGEAPFSAREYHSEPASA
jgi:HEAT repeat protein